MQVPLSPQEQRDWLAEVGREAGLYLWRSIAHILSRKQCPVSPGGADERGNCECPGARPWLSRGQSTSPQASCEMEPVGYKDAPSHCEGLCVKEKKHFAINLTACGCISIIPIRRRWSEVKELRPGQEKVQVTVCEL